MRSKREVDPKSGLLKENTEHGLEVKKIYKQKVKKDSVRVNGAYYPVVSNIGSCITSTPANTMVLVYSYPESVISHSNIVLGRVHDAGKFRSHNKKYKEQNCIYKKMNSIFIFCKITSMEFNAHIPTVFPQGKARTRSYGRHFLKSLSCL